MRYPVLIVLPLLALAACGRSSLDKADGSFDREAFQQLNMRQCMDGMRSTNPSMMQPQAYAMCGCITTRATAGASDEELRGWHRDGQLPVARVQQATEICRATGVGDDERPPPEEPAPYPTDGTPPPLVGPPGDGPAPGGGASVPPGRGRANLSSYFSADDYPAAALRNNQQGRVAFAITVSPEGRVSSCNITQSSGVAALDETTCRILRSRARYTPARDARGVAIAGRDQGTVIWRLPEG